MKSWQTEFGKASGGKGKHSWKGNVLKDADMEDVQVEVRQSQLKGNVTFQPIIRSPTAHVNISVPLVQMKWVSLLGTCRSVASQINTF